MVMVVMMATVMVKRADLRRQHTHIHPLQTLQKTGGDAGDEQIDKDADQDDHDDNDNAVDDTGGDNDSDGGARGEC